jgi:HD-GYP domain-containing protein (c-di-GMP phosphodiesterase class II)
MSDNELKTSIDGLTVGMYVTRLDRPWLETPFPFQGVRIESADDIELMRRHAAYVFVDIEKGPSPLPQFWITGGRNEFRLNDTTPGPITINYKNRDDEYAKLQKCFYEIKTTLENELGNAREIKAQVDSSLKKVMDDLYKGKTLDIDLVKHGVEATVDSILRNPSAFSLLLQLEKTDEYAYAHSLGTSVWCAQFGRHLGLERGEIINLALGGMLLDVGKVKLPTSLLHKREAISPEESTLIHQHVDHSLRILAGTKAIPADVLRMVATHHERADGSGYPEGLQNDAIPIYGRIAGIVDSYDAMTTKRPYTDNIYTPHEAINELYRCRGAYFQAELVEQFIQTVGLYPTGSLVEFESGEVGIVVEVNDLKRLYPTVMLILDKDKQPLAEFNTLNLSRSNRVDMKITKALPHAAYGIKMDQLFL